jgi:hypothetical protein
MSQKNDGGSTRNSNKERLLKQSLNTSRPQRLLSSEYNDRFMKKVVGNMGRIHGVNLEKVRQSNFIKNTSNFSSQGLLKNRKDRELSA